MALRLRAQARADDRPLQQAIDPDRMAAAFGEARRKARYGHRDWFVWVDRQGNPVIQAVTAESIKRAMLDTGTQHSFIYMSGMCSDVLFRVSWTYASRMLREVLR